MFGRPPASATDVGRKDGTVALSIHYRCPGGSALDRLRFTANATRDR